MRIRSILAGFAIGAGALVLSSPGAFADTGAQPTTTTPTSSRAVPAPPSTTVNPREAQRTPPLAPSARPAQEARPQVVKPVGAAETGGGMENSSSNTGMLLLGGAGLVVLAGGGTVAVRRMRKQS